MEDAAAHMLTQRGRALSHPNEVINEDINVGNWTGVEEEWQLESRGQATRVEHKGDSPCGGDQQIPMVGTSGSPMVRTSGSYVVGTRGSPVVGTSGSLVVGASGSPMVGTS